MSNNAPIKLTEDELQKFREIGETYQRVIVEFGHLYIDKIGLQTAADALSEKEEALLKLKKDTESAEKNHIDIILSKYGEGNLSLKDGTFTPSVTK